MWQIVTMSPETESKESRRDDVMTEATGTRGKKRKRARTEKQMRHWDATQGFRTPLSLSLSTDETGGRIHLIFTKPIVSIYLHGSVAFYLSLTAFLGSQCDRQIYWHILTYSGWKHFNNTMTSSYLSKGSNKKDARTTLHFYHCCDLKKLG